MSHPDRGNARGTNESWQTQEDVHQQDAVHDQPTNEELLGQVIQETLDTSGGASAFRIIVRHATRGDDRPITDPVVLADVIHDILDDRFEGKALPVNCHHWIAEQLLEDEQSKQRLEVLWQQAIRHCNGSRS